MDQPRVEGGRSAPVTGADARQQPPSITPEQANLMAMTGEGTPQAAQARWTALYGPNAPTVAEVMQRYDGQLGALRLQQFKDNPAELRRQALARLNAQNPGAHGILQNAPLADILGTLTGPSPANPDGGNPPQQGTVSGQPGEALLPPAGRRPGQTTGPQASASRVEAQRPTDRAVRRAIEAPTDQMFLDAVRTRMRELNDADQQRAFIDQLVTHAPHDRLAVLHAGLNARDPVDKQILGALGRLQAP